MHYTQSLLFTRHFKVLFAPLALCLVIPQARAAWVTQSIPLRPGWNAVHLQVDPADKSVAEVFKGIPVVSVWRWNDAFSPVKFIEDANVLSPQAPGWFSWLPPKNGETAINNLNTIDGGKCYLIQIDSAAAATLQVKGQPVTRRNPWIPNSYSLAGFKIDPANKPTVAAFFDSSSAHRGQPVHRMQASGQWSEIAVPQTERLNPGEAYWVFTRGQSTYDGPLAVTAEQRGSLEFGATVVEQKLSIQNDSSGNQTLSLTLETSETAPIAANEVLGGAVPMSVWRQNPAGQEYGWFPVNGAINLTLAAQERRSVRFAVRRTDLPNQGGADSAFRSLLKIRTSAGAGIDVPVRALATPAGADSAAGARAPRSGGGSPATCTGLWVGTISVNKVSHPTDTTSPNTPKLTASEANLRLMLHVDDSGTVKLLSQVAVMWKDGTKDANGELVEPGRYVLVTDESLISRFKGSTLRDGQPVGRRISSVAFPLAEPLPLSGSFGSSVTGSLTMGYDHPLNPFKHRYHPDHDNLDGESTGKLAEGKESFTIVREIQLQFSEVDPEGLTLAGWGDTHFGGRFTEMISGVHRNPIHVEGTFRVARVSNTGSLDQ